MCTLAYWLDDEGAMNILFNRDEARGPTPQLVPELMRDSGGCEVEVRVVG